MNGSRAKKIRKQIYGDLSCRIQNYGFIQQIKKILFRDERGALVPDKEGKPQRVDKVTRQLVCTGLRAKYKMAKNAWKMQNAGLIPWVFEGHWCKGTWENLQAGLYAKSKIKFMNA